MIGDVLLLSFYKFKWLMQQALEIVPTFSILEEELQSMDRSNDEEPMNGIHLKMSSPGIPAHTVQSLS